MEDLLNLRNLPCLVRAPVLGVLDTMKSTPVCPQRALVLDCALLYQRTPEGLRVSQGSCPVGGDSEGASLLHPDLPSPDTGSYILGFWVILSDKESATETPLN